MANACLVREGRTMSIILLKVILVVNLQLERASLHQFDPYDQTMARLNQFAQLGHHVDKAELIIMGGTMTAREKTYQEWFTASCIRAMNEYGQSSSSPVMGSNPQLKPGEREAIYARNEEAKVRCVAITFETRPDWCRREHIDLMLTLGVTKVEIGVQHLDDRVLELNQRGCTVADAVEANSLLRDAGLKVGFHMMPNLPGSDQNRDREMFKELFSDPRFKPDFLRSIPP